jgi:Ser/Thr protein kinase RdoA (MazF antagonist)
MVSFEARAAQILAAWDLGPEPRVSPIEGGLINRTFLVTAGATRFVLQWVNPLFDPRMHDDIEVVTSHLAARGLTTPRLIATRAPDRPRFVSDPERGVWRLFTFVAGRTLHRVTGPGAARSAGHWVGRFHAAVTDLDHEFRYARSGVHDTAKHLEHLEGALATHTAHPAYDRVAPLAEQILREARALPPLPDAPLRIAHGDLKISNLLFAFDSDEAIALVDLDTLSRFPIAVEMGDAFRSWCNPLGEDDDRAALRPDLFEAAVEGYARGAQGLLLPEERNALVLGTWTIATELAARFCADALYESYFGWNPACFSSRSEHNQVRARAQLAVAQSVRSQRAALERTTAHAFAQSAPSR